MRVRNRSKPTGCAVRMDLVLSAASDTMETADPSGTSHHALADFLGGALATKIRSIWPQLSPAPWGYPAPTAFAKKRRYGIIIAGTRATESRPGSSVHLSGPLHWAALPAVPGGCGRLSGSFSCFSLRRPQPTCRIKCIDSVQLMTGLGRTRSTPAVIISSFPFSSLLLPQPRWHQLHISTIPPGP